MFDGMGFEAVFHFFGVFTMSFNDRNKIVEFFF